MINPNSKGIFSNVEDQFKLFLILVLFLMIIFGCDPPRTHQVTIPAVDDILPTFALTIIGPGIGSKIIRSASRCDVSAGTFAVRWDTVFLQLPEGVEYKFTLTSYDNGGVFRTYIQTTDSARVDLTEINETNAVISRIAGTPDKTVDLYGVFADPRRSMAITGRITAHGRGRSIISMGVIDYGGTAGDNNFDAGVLTILHAPGYTAEVFYEGECP